MKTTGNVHQSFRACNQGSCTQRRAPKKFLLGGGGGGGGGVKLSTYLEPRLLTMKEEAVKETRSGRRDLTRSIFCSSLHAFSHSPGKNNKRGNVLQETVRHKMSQLIIQRGGVGSQGCLWQVEKRLQHMRSHSNSQLLL